MNIKNHGIWLPYKPQKLPKDAPPSALFVRRAGDGVDWYDYVSSGRNFGKYTIKMTVIDSGVAAATKDPTALFPASALVLEVSDVETDDPQKLFGNMIYHADTQTFSDPKRMELPTTLDHLAETLTEIIQRLKALEERERSDAPSDSSR